MKKLKHKIEIWVGLIIVLLGLLPHATIGRTANSPIKIGILQYAKHKALDDVVAGFQSQLEASTFGSQIEWDLQIANGDAAALQSISEKLARENDVLFAVATPAAQSLAAIETKKPIFIAAVTDPQAAGLVKSNEHPSTNVSGTSDMAPIDEQVALLKAKFPSAKTVGILYNSSEVNAKLQAEKAQAALESVGLSVIRQTVTSTNDVAQALDALIKQIDILFMVTDNTIDASIALVGSKLKAAHIPSVGSSASVVLENGLMTLSNSYEDYGRQTADMVLRFLRENLDIAEMPVELGQHFEVVVNDDFAKAIGLDPKTLRDTSY